MFSTPVGRVVIVKRVAIAPKDAKLKGKGNFDQMNDEIKYNL